MFIVFPKLQLPDLSLRHIRVGCRHTVEATSFVVVLDWMIAQVQVNP